MSIQHEILEHILKETDDSVAEISRILGHNKYLTSVTKFQHFPRDQHSVSQHEQQTNDLVFTFTTLSEILHNLQEVRKHLYILGVTIEENTPPEEQAI